MSQDICITKKFNGTRPCFIDEKGECMSVTRTECGVSLQNIPRNAETEKFFQAAAQSGLSDILSEKDAALYFKGGMPKSVDRFMQEARAFVAKYHHRPKE